MVGAAPPGAAAHLPPFHGGREGVKGAQARRLHAKTAGAVEVSGNRRGDGRGEAGSLESRKEGLLAIRIAALHLKIPFSYLEVEPSENH